MEEEKVGGGVVSKARAKKNSINNNTYSIEREMVSFLKHNKM